MSKRTRFIARQPILDGRQRVRAYELLFRSGVQNFFDALDGNAATGQTIADSFLLFGLESLTNNGKAFINFPRELLVNGCANALPAEHVVIELLESIEPDDEVIAACEQLKSRGYTLAIDDYAFEPRFDQLLELVDIIKIDMPQATFTQINKLAERAAGRKTMLLAEKVETQQDFELARQAGCRLFQGYFFSKPIIVSRSDVAPSKHTYLQLLKDLHAPQVDFDGLSKLVESDLPLSFKLLRYINSPVFGLRHEVNSIKHALTLLGEHQIRKWATIVALGEMGSDRPGAVIRMAFVRARFAEQLAASLGLDKRQSDFFLLGLLSLLDTMLGRPLDEIVSELPLASDLRSGLLGAQNHMGQALKLVVAQEKGDWPKVDEFAGHLGIDSVVLAGIYPDAVQFADKVGAVAVNT